MKKSDRQYKKLRESLTTMIFACELAPNLVDHPGFQKFLKTWRVDMPSLSSRQVNLTVSNLRDWVAVCL